MRIKTALTASILLLAVGAAPALAQEQRLDGSAEVVESITRDTGLTDEQLKTLLPAQERAIAIDARLKKSLGEQYGLSYFDSKSEKLIVNVADDELAKQVEAAGATPNFVKHSLRELTEVQVALGGPDTAARQARDRQVRVAVRGALARPDQQHGGHLGHQGAVRGRAGSGRQVRRGRGVRAHPGRGAAGDRVHGRRRRHQRQLLLGRLQPAQPVHGRAVPAHRRSLRQRRDSTLRGQGNVAFGSVLESWFPSYDDAIARYNNNGLWTQGPWVDTNPSNGGIITTTGSTDAPVGTIVCKSGITTKFTCGYIRGKNETVHYDSGETVYGLTRHSACVEPGDSGGANVSYIGGRYRAEGVTSGASLINGQCRSKVFFGIFENVSWYFPIADSLAYYGPKYGVTTW